VLITVLLGAAAAGSAGAERLHFESPAAAGGNVRVGVMKPFDVYLVAERDSGKTQLSAVAYKLQLPAGLMMAGEDLVFRCTDDPHQRIVRFRFLATRPLQGAVLALKPEPRTSFLGVVACRDEIFAKFATPPDSLGVDAR
jgi:hypothetical protein